MKTKIRKDFILHNDEVSIDALVVEANISGYPYILTNNKVYLIKCNDNGTYIRHYDVTEQVEIV